MLDLHTHSSFSDGSDTPAELARAAKRVGLSAIALTDHDTTASHAEMAAACARYDLEYVTGVEVSLRDNYFPKVQRDGSVGPRNIHVLAYFVPLAHDHPFQVKLASLRHDRDVRNRLLIAQLRQFGFERLTIEYLTGLARSIHSIGRPHFAQAMFDLHPEIVGVHTDENWRRVFTDWLGSEGRSYVPKTSMPLEEFVEAARDARVFFSVAHPLVNYLDRLDDTEVATTMPRILASLRERGMHGVEAYYGGTKSRTRALMVKLARDAGLIPTGGSDYHGLYKEHVSLGLGQYGDLYVPDEILDEMRAAVGR